MTATRPLRLIDAGHVPWLRSQALYHGLAHARTADTPDTIVLAVPAEPYVCIGCHQDLEHEVDLDYCRLHGLPVLRRETGGGTVYLDSRQLFVQWVMGPDRLPWRVERRFELFCRPLVATYRELGIAATFRPINDVHVEGRKISGTGAAQIGTAEVLTGNFLLDFDTAVMACVARAPSPAFRAQVERSLQRWLTSIRRELGQAPAIADVTARYVRHCALALGAELCPGQPTAAELVAIERAGQRLADPAFLHQDGGLRRPGFKVHEDVYVVERQGRVEEVVLGPGRGKLGEA